MLNNVTGCNFLLCTVIVSEVKCIIHLWAVRLSQFPGELLEEVQVEVLQAFQYLFHGFHWGHDTQSTERDENKSVGKYNRLNRMMRLMLCFPVHFHRMSSGYGAIDYWSVLW